MESVLAVLSSLTASAGRNALWDRSRQETIGQFAVCSAFEELLECISKADNGQWAMGSVSPGLRFGPHFTPSTGTEHEKPRPYIRAGASQGGCRSDRSATDHPWDDQ